MAAVPGYAAPMSVQKGTTLGGSRVTFRPSATVGRPDLLMQLFEEARAQQKSARDANLARYAEGHDELSRLRTRVLGDIGLQGQQERSSINRQHAERSGATRADLAARGMLGTTVAPTLQAGLDRQRDETLGNLEERLQRLRAGFDTQLTNNLVGFVERRDDVGPNLGMLAQLAQQIGAAGGGTGRRKAAGPVNIRSRIDKIFAG